MHLSVIDDEETIIDQEKEVMIRLQNRADTDVALQEIQCFLLISVSEDAKRMIRLCLLIVSMLRRLSRSWQKRRIGRRKSGSRQTTAEIPDQAGLRK